MLKNHKFMLNVIWLILLFTVPLPLIITLSNGLNILYTDYKLGINLGLFAYVWMLVAIFLASRPKWLDKIIGLPNMYIIHGVTSVLALILMWLHDNLLSSAGIIETTGEFSLYLATVIICYSIVFMASWFTNKIPFLAHTKKFLEKTFKHELSIWIHRLNLLVVIVAYVHIVLISYIREITPFFILVTAYTIISLGTYFIYLLNKNKGYNIGKISNIKIVGTIIHLEITSSKHSLSKIKAGDFIFISLPQYKDLKEQHPFSIVNNPAIDGKIVLGIDTVGDFTKQLQNIKVGEKVIFSNDYGILNNIVKTLPQDEKLILVGGGIGVTSLISLASSFDEKNITFIYTVKQGKDILYTDVLENLQKKHNIKIYAKIGRYTTEQL